MEGSQQSQVGMGRLALNCVIVGGIGIALIEILLPPFNQAGSGRRDYCVGHLRQVGLALQNYHSVHGEFPPAYFADAEGRPMHSWRMMILPYVEGTTAQRIYEQYRWDQPWNSEHNLALTKDYIPSCFVCIDDKMRSKTQTNFFAVTGPGTAWDGATSIRQGDVTDGLRNTVAVCDLAGKVVHWTKPEDVSIDDLIDIMRPVEQAERRAPRPSHDRGTNLLFFDASAHLIPEGVPPETLRALSTIAGDEEFEPPF